MYKTQRNTKKVYRQRHAEAKAKAYKRNKFKNKLNPLDYVEDSSAILPLIIMAQYSLGIHPGVWEK